MGRDAEFMERSRCGSQRSAAQMKGIIVGAMGLGRTQAELSWRALDLRFQYFDDTRNTVTGDFVDQFSALGQPGRLKIFRLLVRAGPQGLCVEDIKQRVPMPGSTLSHHLDTLTRSGLTSPKRSSRFVYYAVDWDKTARLIRFLTEDCCADLHSGLWETRHGPGGPAEPSLKARIICCESDV